MLNYSFIPPAFTSALIFIFMVYFYQKGPRSEAYRALFVLCATTFWWHFSWVFLFLTQDESIARVIAKVGHVGIIALPLTFHSFYASLTHQTSPLRLTKRCTYAFFLGCLIFSSWIIDGVNRFEWGYYPKAGVLHPLFLVVTTFFIIYSLYRNYGCMRKTQDHRKKKLLELCQLGGVVWSLGAIDFLNNYEFTRTYPFGFCFSIVFIGICFSAVENFEVLTEDTLLLQKLASEQKQREEAELRIGQQATQIAHDLRSPIAALEVLSSHIDLSGSHLEIFQKSVSRIKAISHDLLASSRGRSSNEGQHPKLTHLPSPPQSDSNIAWIQGILMEQVIEARYQFQHKKDLEIQFKLEHGCSTLFCPIEPIKLKRILSNLIQNSVDAIENSGKICLSLKHDLKKCTAIILISDNGKGIPPEVLSSMGTKGATFGKEDGNGLGLYDAIQQCENWGGSLRIESQVNQGTEVRVMLPLASTPLWFVST